MIFLRETMKDLYYKLSKLLSYILRHRPEEYSIALDDKGWVDVDVLLTAIKEKDKCLENVTKDDLIQLNQQSNKQRFEIVNDKIRACYGHSIDKTVEYKTEAPPEILYHGTKEAILDSIKKEGLKAMNRQYVHLSSDIDTAKIVAGRRKGKTVILKIKAKEAYKDGCDFYYANDQTWLCSNLGFKWMTIDNSL